MNYQNLCTIVTEQIVEQMKQGVIPWQRPWFGVRNGAVSYETGKPYSFCNQMLLGAEGGEWITFNKCKALGGRIKKGAKHHKIFKLVKDVRKNDKGEDEVIVYYMIYQMFRVGQDTEGLELKWEQELPVSVLSPDIQAEKLVETYSANNPELKICRDEGSNSAFYRPADDSITVPKIEQFDKIAEYYSTLFHEMTHSTGPAKRLNRFNEIDQFDFGSESYSKEELVAEIGAASLVNYVGLDTQSSFRNSTAYIQNWMTKLSKDPQLIMAASKNAQKAINYILNNTKEDN